MIIINQDRTMSFNYENIETIGVGVGNPLQNNDGKFVILVETVSDNQYPIAEYKTKERAEEILEDINHYRAIFEYYKYSPDDIKDDIASEFITGDIMFDTYVMPEE